MITASTDSPQSFPASSDNLSTNDVSSETQLSILTLSKQEVIDYFNENYASLSNSPKYIPTIYKYMLANYKSP